MPAIAEDVNTTHLLDEDQRALFVENCNKRPYLFRHNLCGVEKFQPAYLRRIAQQFVDEKATIYCSPGKGKKDASFDEPDESGKQLTPGEALSQMESQELLFKMPRISNLEEYKPYVETYFNEILEMNGLPTKGYDEWRSISVFMAGPRRITPFHIDAELGYLLQVTGTKTVWVADGTDREILTEQELEGFWRGEGQAAKFKAIAEQRAHKFVMAPGQGIHIPVNFPHWVENGDEVSMSVSLGIHLAKYRPGAVYRFNSYLRQMHLQPTPPGKMVWLDAAKEGIYEFSKAASRKRMPAKA